MTGVDGPAAVPRWWRGALASGLPQHADHPAIRDQPAAVVGKVVPMYIHYDGAEFYQTAWGVISAHDPGGPRGAIGRETNVCLLSRGRRGGQLVFSAS
eukprot:1182370-Pyramimonas_sp.AAC.1